MVKNKIPPSRPYDAMRYLIAQVLCKKFFNGNFLMACTVYDALKNAGFIITKKKRKPIKMDKSRKKG